MVVPAHAVVAVSFRSVNVIVPAAVEEAPVSVAVSWTTVPKASGPETAIPVELLITVVERVGVKKIAEAERARSWLPMPVVSIESRIMWYGEPLMLVAELPVPQSCCEAMWPPQARTTVHPPAGAVPERVNVTAIVVLHCPVPDATFCRPAG
jgi:hypothetical protein